MIFKQGGVYSHRKMLDCCIYVRSVSSVNYDSSSGKTEYMLNVLWFNKQGRMITDDKFKVRETDDGWYEYEVPNVKA